MVLFRPIKGLNSNLLHTNVTKMTNKFTEYLKETVEIHVLKFLPSQYFLVQSNQQRSKILYKYNFRNQSIEEEYSDLSQNSMYLESLNYHIQKIARSDFGVKNKRPEENGRPIVKSTHSGTKSKMNQHIDTIENEDRKNSDEDTEYYEFLKENQSSFEFTIPGFVTRIKQIRGVPKPSHGDAFYSVIVFHRYVRRRRTARKDKDPKGEEKVNKLGWSSFPVTNLKERQLIMNSFNSFIRNSLVVDKDSLLKVTIGTKQRKRILAATKRARLDLDDTKGNPLIQSYVQSKEIKGLDNKKKNLFTKSSAHIQVAKSPFDYKNGIVNPDEINISINDSISYSNTSFNETEEGDNRRQEFYLDSENSMSLFKDSLAGQERSPGKHHHQDILQMRKMEAKSMAEFFEDDDSSIFQSREESEDNKDRGSKIPKHRRHARVFAKNLKEIENEPSETKFSNFFGMLIHFRS